MSYLNAFYGPFKEKRWSDVDCRCHRSYLIAFGMNYDFGLGNKADIPHLPVTLGTDKRICFVHLSDEVIPAPFYFLGDGWMRGLGDPGRFFGSEVSPLFPSTRLK